MRFDDYCLIEVGILSIVRILVLKHLLVTERIDECRPACAAGTNDHERKGDALLDILSPASSTVVHRKDASDVRPRVTSIENA